MFRYLHTEYPNAYPHCPPNWMIKTIPAIPTYGL